MVLGFSKLLWLPDELTSNKQYQQSFTIKTAGATTPLGQLFPQMVAADPSLLPPLPSNIEHRLPWPRVSNSLNTEVQQTRSILFRCAPIARSVTQILFGHLSLDLRANRSYLGHRSGNWGTARVDFLAVLNLVNTRLRCWFTQQFMLFDPLVFQITVVFETEPVVACPFFRGFPKCHSSSSKTHSARILAWKP